MEFLPLLTYLWAAAFDAWSDPAAPYSRAPLPEDPDSEFSSLDLEVIRIVYGAMLAEVGCADRAQPVDPTIQLQIISGSGTPRIMVTVRYAHGRHSSCRAVVTARDGDLQFGPLQPRHRWQTAHGC
ncbi:hypothetical protein [Microlunatus ginsengisoli]|uniref:Uncharacterized protein n=1 Tax=Microlunatus ginsengisoli TaxID=363863 RepID=A0ABP7AZ16_9ACTN